MTRAKRGRGSRRGFTAVPFEASGGLLGVGRLAGVAAAAADVGGLLDVVSQAAGGSALPQQHHQPRLPTTNNSPSANCANQWMCKKGAYEVGGAFAIGSRLQLLAIRLALTP